MFTIDREHTRGQTISSELVAIMVGDGWIASSDGRKQRGYKEKGGEPNSFERNGLHLLLPVLVLTAEGARKRVRFPPLSSRDSSSLRDLRLLCEFALKMRVGCRSTHAHLAIWSRRPHEKGLISPLLGVCHKSLPTCKNSYYAIGSGVESKQPNVLQQAYRA